MRIDESAVLRLSEALVHLYKPGLNAGTFARRASDFVADLIPSELVVYGSLNRSSGDLDLLVDKPVPAFGEAMECFAQHMGQSDLFNWTPAVNGGKPFFRSDFFSEREFASSGMFSDVYRRLGIDNHCAVLIPRVDKEIAFFGIERLGGPDYNEEDRALLALAQPHLSNARELAAALSDPGGADAKASVLTRHGLSVREAEVLCWIAEGKSNDEIAMLLQIKLYTVKGYVKAIFQKIGAPNRLAAALWALRVSQADDGSAFTPLVKRVHVPDSFTS